MYKSNIPRTHFNNLLELSFDGEIRKLKLNFLKWNYLEQTLNITLNITVKLYSFWTEGELEDNRTIHSGVFCRSRK